MSVWSSWLTMLQTYASAWTAQTSGRRWLTGLAVVAGAVWMYRRIEQARAAERRVRVLRDARGNVLPANIALNQHAPSPLPPAHSSSSSGTADPNDVRHLTPAQRYLSERGSRVRRQSVCITLATHNRVVFDTPAGDALTVQEAVVPLLLSLAQTTLLHCIVVEADKTKQAEILSALGSIGLFDSGLKPHRVLFCTTTKGKSAMVRHIEPNLCVDDDRAMLAALKPFIDQVAHVAADAAAMDATKAWASASTSSAASDVASVPSYPSLAHFFLPQQQQPQQQQQKQKQTDALPTA